MIRRFWVCGVQCGMSGAAFDSASVKEVQRDVALAQSEKVVAGETVSRVRILQYLLRCHAILLRPHFGLRFPVALSTAQAPQPAAGSRIADAQVSIASWLR